MDETTCAMQPSDPSESKNETIDLCNLRGYSGGRVIKSIKHKGLKDLFDRNVKKGVNSQHVDKLLLAMDRLDSASEPEDMMYPGSDFHRLKGKRKDTYSVAIAGNWKLTFRFKDGAAEDVNYEDYH